MYGVCLRYSGSEDDAKDILQDGFVKIYEKIHQFKFQGSFEGWMRRIFVNTALERYRGQYQIISIHDGYNESDMYSYDHINNQINTNDLLKIINQLSPKYRMVFNLYAIEGYSHKEIAEMLNITEGTSKSNLSRARMILQDKIHQLYNVASRIGI